MVLEGGPKDSFWFYADDLEAEQKAAQSMAPWQHHRPAVLDYRKTKRRTDHPSARGPSNEPITGQVWAYQPD